MLSHLLESRRARERRPAVLALSVAVRVTLGALAVVGTLRAGTEDPPPPEVIDPIFLPDAPDEPPTRTSSSAGGGGGDAVAPRPDVDRIFEDVVSIDPGIPPVDPGAEPTPDDFRRGGGGVSSLLGAAPGGGPVGGGPFSLAQVERAVIALPGSPVPRFPEMLRAGGIEGRVLARFVVDSSGRMEPASFEVLSSTHELFAASVREALGRTRFAPAEAGGRRVRQLVEQAFVFAIER